MQGTLCGLGTLLGTTTQAASLLEELTFESRPREAGDVAGDREKGAEDPRTSYQTMMSPRSETCPLSGRLHEGLPSCSYRRILESLALAAPEEPGAREKLS